MMSSWASFVDSSTGNRVRRFGEPPTSVIKARSPRIACGIPTIGHAKDNRGARPGQDAASRRKEAGTTSILSRTRMDDILAPELSAALGISFAIRPPPDHGPPQHVGGDWRLRHRATFEQRRCEGNCFLRWLRVGQRTIYVSIPDQEGLLASLSSNMSKEQAHGRG